MQGLATNVDVRNSATIRQHKKMVEIATLLCIQYMEFSASASQEIKELNR